MTTITGDEVRSVAEVQGKDWAALIEPLGAEAAAEVDRALNATARATQGRFLPTTSLVARAGSILLNTTSIIGVSTLMGQNVAEIDGIREHALVAREILKIALEQLDRALRTN